MAGIADSSPSIQRHRELGGLETNRRILVVDDQPGVLNDYRKILSNPNRDAMVALSVLGADLFGGKSLENPETFEIQTATSGLAAVETVAQSMVQNEPFAVAFIDVQMPPGIDGIETAERIWAIDHRIEIVISSAYSDYSLDEIHRRLGGSDQLLILRKPFDPIEVRQLAIALTLKRSLSELAKKQYEEAQARIASLEGLLPVCMHCRKIRNPSRSWVELETFIKTRDGTDVTHAICPDCLEKHHPE